MKILQITHEMPLMFIYSAIERKEFVINFYPFERKTVIETVSKSLACLGHVNERLIYLNSKQLLPNN